VIRYDRGALNAPTTDKVQGRAARVHDQATPLVYESGHEYRDLAELANIVRDLERGVAVLWDHNGPKVGVTTGARIDGDHVIVSMDLDEATRARVRIDRRELSLGYVATLDDDRYQRGIQVFELAIVERGRCGATCAITHADHMTRDVERDLARQLADQISNAWRSDATACACDHKDND
jgi:hypothetical protein